MLTSLTSPTSQGNSLFPGPSMSSPSLQLQHVDETTPPSISYVDAHLVDEEEFACREKVNSHRQGIPLIQAKEDESCIDKPQEKETAVSTSEKPPGTASSNLPKLSTSLTILMPSNYTDSKANSGFQKSNTNDGRQLYYLVPVSAANNGSSILEGVIPSNMNRYE